MRSLTLVISQWCLETVQISYFSFFFSAHVRVSIDTSNPIQVSRSCSPNSVFFLIPLFLLSSLFCIRPHIPPSLWLCLFIHALQCGLWGFHYSTGYNASPTLLGGRKRSGNVVFIHAPLQARGRVESSPSMCKVWSSVLQTSEREKRRQVFAISRSCRP